MTRRLPRAAHLAPALLILALAVVESANPRPVIRLTDVTRQAGIDFDNVCGAEPDAKGWLTEAMGAGAAWLDYDGDGHLDLYLVNGSTHERKAGAGEPNRLYRGDGKGGFTDVTSRAGVGDRGWGYGVTVGDYDGDGDADIYVTNLGANVLYRNAGDGTFREVASKAGVADPSWGASAAFFDMDGDRDLDLYVTNYVDFDPKTIPRGGSPEARIRTTCTVQGVPVFCGPLGLKPAQDVLYRNDGDGTFTDVTRAAGVFLEKPRYALGVVATDFDRDGDVDVYVANDSVPNSLWRNDGKGRFEDVGLATLSALSASGRPQAGMGTASGDYNGDEWPDLVVTNFSHDLNTLYRSHAGRFFSDESLPAGLGVTNLNLSWGVEFVDLDNDGDLDLFIANGHLYPVMDRYDNGLTFRQRNHLFLNEGGRFREIGREAGPGLRTERSFRGAAFADYDEDGDVDAVVTALDEGVLLLRNDTANAGQHLAVRLIGTSSNRDAVGARVTVSAGGRRITREVVGGGSYLSRSSSTLHFGLGAATSASRVEIRWPDGKTQVLENQRAGRTLVVRQDAPVKR